ncbi:hypothetical protein [Sharpea azabuensis]|uniref:hypothetical protein n=1 Tax=Sharpea azabuensis TaxID=322505 RepID=UPI002E80C54F|nr:hypothetical protein [Sharpea azabuensis]MEE3307871.1 hypothetical protein [Sharpea azabuensis]
MSDKPKRKIKCEIYRDSMQNYKKYAIPPAQLIIADVPYNIGNNFYGSNPMWYVGGTTKMVSLNLQRNLHLIQTLISIYTSIFTFAQR